MKVVHTVSVLLRFAGLHRYPSKYPGCYSPCGLTGECRPRPLQPVCNPIHNGLHAASSESFHPLGETFHPLPRCPRFRFPFAAEPVPVSPVDARCPYRRTGYCNASLSVI